MTDIASIAGALGAVTQSYQLLKAAVDLRDFVKAETAMVDLLGKVNMALVAANAAQEEISEKRREIQRLNDEITTLRDWASEAKKYSLVERVPGVFVYRRTEDSADAQPMHDICANCYGDRKKSVLQLQHVDFGRVEVLVCTRCDSKTVIRGHLPDQVTGRRARR